MPSLNVRPYIEECIESVLAQSLREMEILCIDAGSSDGTYELLKEYSNKDSRIQLLQSPIRSYGYQMNMGLKRAKGKYIGIVETDDYIMGDMYKCLFEMAENHNVDFVKADYCSYHTLSNKKRVFVNEHFFGVNSDEYNRILVPRENKIILEKDSSIWRGIYNTDFLRRNNIWFHESPGAAFQDIGFMVQVLCYAKSAMYLNHPLYCYCMDRDSSSSNSDKGLKFVVQEFRWLLEEKEIIKNASKTFVEGFFERLFFSFVGEYKKSLLLHDELNDLNTSSYQWFRDILIWADKSGYIADGFYTKEVGSEIRILMESEEVFREAIKNRIRKIKDRDSKISQTLQRQQVIVFGCGKYGKEALLLLDRMHISPVAFCDNNSKLWKTDVAGVPVLSLSQCLEKYENAYYLVAMKQNYNEIIRQLSCKMIKNSHIILYNV